MMDYKLLFGVLSAALAVICFVPYIIDIFKRKTEPHAYSWLVWTLLQAVGVTAQLKDGAGYGAWGLLIGTFFCFSVFILSLKFGTKNIARFDLVCLVAALISILIYIGIENAMWAVVVVTLVDLVGFLPTFRKGYAEPYTETTSVFFLSAIANVFSIIAMQNYSVVTVLYVASLVITNSIMVLIITTRRRVLVPKLVAS